MTEWLAGSTIPLPPANRVQFFTVRACAPARCVRCNGPLHAVADGLACAACPWHAVIRESVRETLKHGYVASKGHYEIDALDNREGLSTKVFFRARGRFCSTG